MNQFIYRVIVYLLSFALSLYGLSALDFNRFLKKNKVTEAQVLYFLLALALAYLVGSLLMSIIYFFNV